MRFQSLKRGRRRVEVQPEFEQLDDKIISTTSWVAGDGRQQERFQVITLCDGKITDMQGFASRRKAERFAHR